MDATTAALVGALAEYRDFADTLVQIRTSKGSAAAAAPLTAACAAAGTALLLRARELERGALLAAQGLKDASGEQRGRLDHDALALHNLVYEQQYYDKEIASCRAFRSAVAEEQIGSDAPPCGANHDAELARLTAELQARKALKAQLASLEARRAAEQERRAAAQALVDDLRAHLTAVSATSKPLLDRSLPAGGSAIKDDREAAELLPLPLYIIYSQAATGASIVGLPLRVGVQGSVAAAQQEQQQQQQGDGQQQQQGASAQDAKRRRKSVQQGDKTYKVCDWWW
jgi:THO complex subunit 5